MNPKLRLALIALTLTLGLSPARAFADTITLTLTQPDQMISQQTAGSLAYVAILTADPSNQSDVFLNGDSFDVSSPLSLDDSDFSGFPLTLAPGTTFTGNLFVVNVPGATSLGTYTGSFSLLGGADEGAVDVLGTVTFTTTVTPEPSSIVLLSTGIAGVLVSMRRSLQG